MWLEPFTPEADGKENVQRAIDEHLVDVLAFFASGPESVDLDGENVFAESLPEQCNVFVERHPRRERPRSASSSIAADRLTKRIIRYAEFNTPTVCLPFL